MTEPSRDLCLFDLDHTLLPVDSDHAWNEFMITLGWVDAVSHRKTNDRFYEQYLAGTLDIAEYVEFTTRALRQRPAGQADEARRRFMAQVIEPALRPQALSLVPGAKATVGFQGGGTQVSLRGVAANGLEQDGRCRQTHLAKLFGDQEPMRLVAYDYGS